MALSRLAQVTLVCAITAVFPIGNAAADPAPAATASSGGEVSPALIGLAPATRATQAPQPHRKLWIALGIVSGVAVVGAIVAVGVSLGTSSNNNSVFNDWGTLNVSKR